MKFFALALIAGMLSTAVGGAQNLTAAAEPPQNVAAKPAPTPAVTPDPEPTPSIAPKTPVLLEPEWPGTPYLVAGGKLVPLESQRRDEKVKIKALGIGGGSAGYAFRPATSPVKVSTTNPEFLIKIDLTGDPSTLVGLDKLTADQKKDVRTIVIAKVGAMAMSQKNVNDSEVALRFSKLGNSLKFTPAVPLIPGEYMITTRAATAYLFSVEPAK